MDNKADPSIASIDNSFVFILATGHYSATTKRIIETMDLKAVMNSIRHGNTLALTATGWNNLEFLQHLADAGADFNIADSEGLRPLDHALKYKDDTIKYHGVEHAEKMITLLKNHTHTNH